MPKKKKKKLLKEENHSSSSLSSPCIVFNCFKKGIYILHKHKYCSKHHQQYLQSHLIEKNVIVILVSLALRQLELFEQKESEQKEINKKLDDIDLLYQKGIFYYKVEKDLKKAIQVFKKLYKEGHINSTYHLGTFYLNGYGVKMNKKKAFVLFEEAYKKETHIESSIYLGWCYYNGWGIKQNRKRANEICKEVIVPLEEKYNNMEKYNNDNNYNNNAHSIFLLGLCYRFGWGVEKNEKKATKLIEEAHNLGDIKATYQLSVCYMLGWGVDINEKRAIQLKEEYNKRKEVK